jgi:hypothetical protein
MDVILVHYGNFNIPLGISIALLNQVRCGGTFEPHRPSYVIVMGLTEGTRTQNHLFDVLRFLLRLVNPDLLVVYLWVPQLLYTTSLSGFSDVRSATSCCHVKRVK